jgi:LPXTG-site transpeptidase (sortase) family protein
MEGNQEQKGMVYASKLEQRIVFFFVAMGIIALTYGVLVLVDFLPEKPKQETAEVKVEALIPTDEVVTDPFPVKIIFDSLDREVVVLNPITSTIAALDAELLKGVVRHPDSADFKEVGTIFILGHSSYLPNIHNKNFQAFNGIQKLKWGETIRLQSADREYVYKIDRVYETKATEAEVPIQHEAAKLVLATCNSFGSKDDRFIVEATLVSSTALPKTEGK